MQTLNELDKLNLRLGFEEWAQREGFSMESADSDTGYTDSRTFDAWRGYLAAHTENGPSVGGQQLYARIKKKSQYAHQTDDLFPIRVDAPPYGNFAVHGGPGGVYPITDVEFYVIENGMQYRLK
ncbi:hypothetical protein LG197_23655 [Pseudomonas asiatica]|uniref:hypothetical protein n=1 Tax=Pseudomonas asiatica TaxID=2219225 RepID=UPI0023683E90|nr:hypothetical protein [Pseudomonas asiatica]WDM87569.1 hypothetical protein LG197_23655 [Pseudomonas asiatica]